MKKTVKLLGIIALVAVIGFTFTACKNPDDTTGGKTLTGITLNTDSVKKAYVQSETLNLTGLVVNANYSDSTSAAVTNYTANPADGAALNTTGQITVTISYTEGGVTKSADFSVTVAADTPAAITYTAAQTGGADNTADSTGIVFTFSASVTGLTADHITLTNGTGSVTKGALSGSGTSWTLGITVTTAGNVSVAIAKTGIEAGTKNVTVFKQGQAAPTLTGITANYNQTATVFPSTEIDSLKAELTVKAQYSNSSETTLSANEYTLSVSGGALTVGANTVTVTYQGQSADFTVNVTAAPVTKTLTGITLNTDSVKKAYVQNETLDLTGLVVTANYSDSTSAAVTNYTASPADGAALNTIGNDIKVTITYTEGGVTKDANFNVTVTAAPVTKTLSGIAITTPPSKTTYIQGEQLNLSGIVVTASYSDGTSAAVTTYTADPANGAALSVTGETSVTISYTEGDVTKTEKFIVNVTATPITDVTYAAAQTGGTSNTVTTTDIVFTFSASVDSLGLTAADFTVGGAASKGSAALTGTGITRTLAITVSAEGNATVSIAKTGIEAVTKNVAVYKVGESSAGITINVKQIEDEVFEFEPITISRTGSNDIPVTFTVTVENASGYSGIDWEVAGVGAGQNVTGSDASFTLDAADVNYNSFGGHALILTVTKGEGADAVQYIRAIPFTVVQ